MGKKIKSTVKVRFKKKQKKKKRYNLVRAKIIIFNYNSARQTSIILFGEWSQKAVLVDPIRRKIVNTKSRKLISVKWISFGTENHLYGCYVPDRPTSGLNIHKCAHITKFSRTARMRSTMPRSKFLLFFSRPWWIVRGDVHIVIRGTKDCIDVVKKKITTQRETPCLALIVTLCIQATENHLFVFFLIESVIADRERLIAWNMGIKNLMFDSQRTTIYDIRNYNRHVELLQI